MKNKAIKVEIHRFWVRGLNCTDVSRDRLFVAKVDYDRAVKKIKELETKLAKKHVKKAGTPWKTGIWA
jgi:hypothetical protein